MLKSVLMSLVVVGVVGGMVGGGLFAAFSDTETSEGNLFTAGTLDLKVNGMDDPDVGAVLRADCVAPGDMGEAYVDLMNEGCVGGLIDFHIMNVVDYDNGCNEPESEVDSTCGNPGPGEGELSQYIYIDVICNGSLVVSGPLVELECINFIIGYMDPYGYADVVILWSVDPSAGNIIQSDSVEFEIEFSLDQDIII
jgi:predicted ribosomally synthesized peptide with SipW-like signal peptide